MRIKRMTTNVSEKIASMAIWMLGLGVVLAIWGGVWGVYLFRNPPGGEALYLIAIGIFLTGLDLMLIGLFSGRIGRSARDEAEKSAHEPDRVAVVTPEGDRAR